MASTTAEYARAAQSLAVIEGILTNLADVFANQQPRTVVDEAMIDALVASANALSATATSLKAITYTPPV